MEIVVLMALVFGGVGFFVDGVRGLALGILLGPVGLIVCTVMITKK